MTGGAKKGNRSRRTWGAAPELSKISSSSLPVDYLRAVARGLGNWELNSIAIFREVVLQSLGQKKTLSSSLALREGTLGTQHYAVGSPHT